MTYEVNWTVKDQLMVIKSRTVHSLYQSINQSINQSLFIHCRLPFKYKTKTKNTK